MHGTKANRIITEHIHQPFMSFIGIGYLTSERGSLEDNRHAAKTRRFA